MLVSVLEGRPVQTRPSVLVITLWAPLTATAKNSPMSGPHVTFIQELESLLGLPANHNTPSKLVITLWVPDVATAQNRPNSELHVTLAHELPSLLVVPDTQDDPLGAT
jgi:hypothetical protein